jgi:glycosyltransferase involved in cell wall biosynthesis
VPSERVTVAIPFHSGIEYLKEAVASVLGQTDPDWQLLVVDDGGREQGVEIWVASLRDARVTYLRNPRNLGWCAAGIAAWRRRATISCVCCTRTIAGCPSTWRA